MEPAIEKQYEMTYIEVSFVFSIIVFFVKNCILTIALGLPGRQSNCATITMEVLDDNVQ